MKSTPHALRMLARWTGLALLLAACTMLEVSAQLPVFRGKSNARSGMLYYDRNQAEDRRPRLYAYTLCPDSAACVTLDFNLVMSEQQGDDDILDHGTRMDFIQVYDGQDDKAPLLATLGKATGNQLIQSHSGCITVVFKRDETGENSIWTAQWLGKSEAACIRPESEGPCADVQDVCGPDYHENFHYYNGTGRPESMKWWPGTCIEYQRNASWYRFMAQKDGALSFNIYPDNGFDDFDWVLLRGDAKNPKACPDLAQEERKLACNYAQGRGPKGSTGMGEWGESTTADAGQCPYSSTINAKKGDVFYLLIDDYSQHSQGFRLEFNDVVMTCTNPQKDLLPIDQRPVNSAEKVDPRKTFNQYTRILRIDLDEKANLPIAEAIFPSSLFELRKGTEFSHGKAAVPYLPIAKGIVSALLDGLKTAKLQAVSASDLQTPVHYGDLLELARRQTGDSTAISGSWWNGSAELLDRFMHVVELVVDETIDNSGKPQRKIRFVRLLWTDRDGIAPDYTVAVFDYSLLSGLLDQIPIANAKNDVHSLSIRDFLEQRMYSAVTVSRAGNNFKNLQQSRFSGEKQIELDNFIWQR